MMTKILITLTLIASASFSFDKDAYRFQISQVEKDGYVSLFVKTGYNSADMAKVVVKFRDVVLVKYYTCPNADEYTIKSNFSIDGLERIGCVGDSLQTFYYKDYKNK